MDETSTADLEARIAMLERQTPRSGERRETMEMAMWAIMRNVFPEETRRHVKAAGREQLLAARSYLDHWIAKLDEAEAEVPEKRETIEVE